MKPTHAAVKTGYKLQANGVDVASTGIDVTKWKLIPIEYDPAVTYSSVLGSCSDLRTWLASFASSTLTLGSDNLTFKLVDNGTPTNFVRDATVTEVIFLKAGTVATMQVDIYPGGAARCRVRHRINASTNLATSYIQVNGFTATGSALNTGRGLGSAWNGRLSGTLTSSAPVHLFVHDAIEKFPRGYVASGSDLNITMHDDSIPEDTTLATGVYDLSAILSTNLDITMPASYMAMLNNASHPVRGAYTELAPVDQTNPYGNSDVWISMDFWLSLSAVDFTAPVLLLDGYDSEIWWYTDLDDPSASGMEVVEDECLAMFQSWLVLGARGQLLYGDFAHEGDNFDRETDQEAWQRVRMLNHYFHVTAAWRAFLRTGNQSWYELCRVFANVDRDVAWYGPGSPGWKMHGKGLAPWSGAGSLSGHFVDSESLLFGWLVDADYHALEYYERYLTGIAAYSIPMLSGRELNTCKRQLDVAYWYTGDTAYQTKADPLNTALMNEIAVALADSKYINYKYIGTTGVNWQPYWPGASHGFNFSLHEGVFAGKQMYLANTMGTTDRDGVSTPERSPLGFIKYARDHGLNSNFDYFGPGPIGEYHRCLNLDIVYKYLKETGEDLSRARTQMIYGANAPTGDAGDATVTVHFRKTDENPSHIRLLLNGRLRGDIQQHRVYLTDPNSVVTNLTASLPGGYVPHYSNIGGGAFAITDMEKCDIRGGFTGYQKILPFSGPSGDYEINVVGRGGIIFGPMTIYEEWQFIDETLEYEGQNEWGEWPLEAGQLTSPPSGFYNVKIFVQQSQQSSVLYGVNDKFKVNVSLVSGGKRKRGNVLHLTKAKTQLSSVFALFDAVVHGINLDAEEFEYVSEDQLLTITNVSGVTGIESSVSAGVYAIPLFPAVDYGVAFSTIHLPKLPTATAGV